jgi:predicted aspartyl protease
VAILHIQFGAQGKTADGGVVQLPPGLVLEQRGPVVQVVVMAAEPLVTQLLQQGITPPEPVPGLALIDTGASITCVDDDAAASLKLPVVDVVTIASASHASTNQNVYPVAFQIQGLPVTVNSLRTVGAPLRAQGLLALLGRDLLQHFTLFYNGLTGQITLAI